MVARIHSLLARVVHRSVIGLPGPVLRRLDAWSARVARKRALQRQLRWQQRVAAKAAACPDR